MKRLLLLIISALMFSCENSNENTDSDKKKTKMEFNKDDYERDIIAIKSLIDSISSVDNDYNVVGRKLIDDIIEFANNYPYGENVVDFLFTAAKTANGIGEYRESVKILDKIINKYPGYPNIKEVLFLKAFTYDENLNNKEKAKDAYLKIIQEFPKDPLASESKILLENLYLSDKELIEKYKANN